MIKWRFILLSLVILLVGALGGSVWAQGGEDGAKNTLVLLSVDDERPVLFQALAPGDEPVAADFVPRLEVSLDGEQEQNVIYTAVENTGWSLGAVGLIGEALDPGETYVALELWERLGNLTLRDDGQGMIFPLAYVEDLDGDETPGFRLDVVIDQGRVFRLYRVVEGDGLYIRGQVIEWDGRLAEPKRASYTVALEPVLGDLLLDFHIIALPRPVPTPEITEEPTVEPVPTPEVTGEPTVEPLPTPGP